MPKIRLYDYPDTISYFTSWSTGKNMTVRALSVLNMNICFMKMVTYMTKSA
ncbi:hypothetical protein [Hallella multisaccharivorax]|uniref:hypothetical protein n=1 Tax=Hallella multisaccharivorax TaxID=310514 RepID=UPI0012EAE454|nr:hypothetical protein [Hallella multisaccharivorax]